MRWFSCCSFTVIRMNRSLNRSLIESQLRTKIFCRLRASTIVWALDAVSTSRKFAFEPYASRRMSYDIQALPVSCFINITWPSCGDVCRADRQGECESEHEYAVGRGLRLASFQQIA